VTEIAVAADRDLWDRQPGESAKAFAAFQHYRDQTPSSRSILNTAKHIAETVPSRTDNVDSITTQLKVWASPSKWNWVARVEAFEIAEDRRLRLERAARQRTMEDRHQAVADRLLLASLARMQGAPDLNVSALDPNQIGDWSEVSQVAERAVRIGRLTLGLPTDLTKSMDTWKTEDVARLTRAVIDVMLPYIAEEQQHDAVSRVQDVFLGWGRR
jgi:hypothetical protein